MKIKNQLKKIGLISLILILILACFRSTYAASKLGTWTLEGIVGILTLGIQQFAVLLFSALQLLTAAITGLAGDNSAGAIGDVVFNRCGLTSANFFPEVWVGPDLQSGTLEIVKHIRTYYNVIRNLSIAMLLGVLLYIGIRMAISTVASEEAKYKKMLKDWVVSLILVFVLHYIMIITFFINNVLVQTLSTIDPNPPGVGEWAKLAGEALIPGAGIPYLIVYGAFVIATIAFVLMYVRRTIVLAFLIVIAPLITVTYAIDKIGDGKSQALNTWMREFIFTVIIQPFHCVIYLVFYKSVMDTLNSTSISDLDLGRMIFAAGSAFFMLKAENIVKKIFGIQPSSIGDALGTGAMALTMATSIFKGGKGKKIDESKGKMPTMEGNGPSSGTEGGTPPAGGGTPPGDGGTPPGDGGTPPGDGGGTPPGDGGTPPGGGGTPPGDGGGTPPAGDAEPSGLKSTLDKLGKTRLGKSWKRNGGLPGWAGRKISGAATLAGFIAGGTVGDFKTAASVATAAGGIAKNKYDDLEYKIAERKLENNQEVFAGAYEDFAAAYREQYGQDIDDQTIRAAAQHIYEGGGQDLTSEYERDFYNQMEQLSDSAEIMGYKNGFTFVNESMRLAQEGAIEPPAGYRRKHYPTPSGGGTPPGGGGGTP